MDRPDRPDAEVLSAWGLEGARIELAEQGHINRTFRIDSALGSFILQWVSPIFGPEVHEDIAAITAELTAAGVETPLLQPTRTGKLFTVDAAGRVWRLLTYVSGRTLARAESPACCREAGMLLGRFHGALWESQVQFRHTRLGVHDTPGHLRALERALEECRGHRRYTEVAELAQEIQNAADRLELGQSLPLRVVHGDPKIQNFLFAPDGRAVCLVDLDTLGRMPLAVELGDALRSWCNPAGEEVEAPFAVDFFEAGIAGWAAGLGPRPAPFERDLVPALIETIAIELSARFCADALRESYFGWNRAVYPSASDHNLLRARVQLQLGLSIRAERPVLEGIVRRVFG